MAVDSNQQNIRIIRRNVSKRSKSLAFRMGVFRVFVLWQLVGAIVYGLAVFDPGLDVFGRIGYATTFCVFLGIITFASIYTRRQLKGNGERLSPFTEGSLAPMLSNLVSRFRELFPKTRDINLLVNREDLGMSPAAIPTRKGCDIIIPLGFLRLTSENRSVAEAMLAHELAHCTTGNATKIIQTHAIAVWMLRLMLPLAVVTALLLPFIGNSQFELGVDAQRSELEMLLREQVSDPIAARRGFEEEIAVKRDDHGRKMRLSQLHSGISVLVILGLFLIGRGFRFEAEYLADGVAALVVGEDPVREYIERFHSDDEPNLWKFHPSKAQRGRALNKWSKVLPPQR